jgi:mono/diheme cytochrome c family protein
MSIGRFFDMRATPLLAAAVAFVLSAAPGFADELQLPPGPNRELVYGQCRTCHDLQYLIESAGVPRDTWSELLDSMKQYGLRIAPDQRAKILEYLGTYLGPNPPPAIGASAPAAPAKVDGAAVFKDQCTACHQENAQGVPEQFPPLAGNSDLFLSADFPARVVLFGLEGKINVNGKKFDSVMPPLDVLSDEQIAAVIAYVRSNFGNAALKPKDMTAIDAAAVAKLRAKKDTTSAQIFVYRKKLKGGS